MSPRLTRLLVILLVLTATLQRPRSRLATAAEPDTRDPVRLRTEYLPTPLQLPGDKARRSITAIEIRGDIPDQGDSSGTLTFDQSELAFNAFGDARVDKAKPAEPTGVTFRRIKVEAKRGLVDRS